MLDKEWLWCVYSNSDKAQGYGSTYAVRPIVTINHSLLDNVTGSGTSADPYVIQ